MMPARNATGQLIERLPRVRGRYDENAPIAPWTWFRVGGPAEVMFRPADRDDLAAFLKAKPSDVAVTVIGAGSNLLVRDGGVKGVVVRLDRPFAHIGIAGDEVRAGAMALGIKVSLTARDAGLAGLEFLSGVPGTIGGALRMNAGAYGRETKDVLIEAEALDAKGALRRIPVAEMGFTYRHSDVPEDWIFVAARLQGQRDDPAAIARRIAEIGEVREDSQPVRTRTGGSTFKNPPGARAWELIDRAGCRGLKRGKATVSDKHTNFLINTGGATASDLEGLGEEVRRRVLDATGVKLEWEIRVVGVPLPSRPEVVV
jgi:UDP-N-acetylmuramate dehydrogenase